MALPPARMLSFPRSTPGRSPAPPAAIGPRGDPALHRYSPQGETPYLKHFMIRFPYTAVVLLLLAACATSSAKSMAEVTPEEAPRLMLTPADLERGKDCVQSGSPTPTLEELTDSAAVHAELERLQREAGPVQGRALLSIRVDSTGATEWIDILETDLPAPVSAGIVRAFEGRLKLAPTEGKDGPRLTGWLHRVEVRLAGSPAIRVGNPVFCVPRLVNEREITLLLEQAVGARPDINAMLKRPRTVHVRVWVDESGRPTKSEVYRSSLMPAVDGIALGVVDSMVFRPATRDRRPLRVIIEIPITVRSSESP